MTQGEMLLLLYDELIKRLRRGKIELEKGMLDKFEEDLVRAQEIIRYLRKILDRKYQIAKDLGRLYNFYEGFISRIIASRKPEQIDELLPMIQDLRDAFAQADKAARMQVQANGRG